MENKTPRLTKLILIFESALLATTLISFYFLKGAMKLPEGLLWLWMALMVFSVVSFLFFLVVLIIALAKKSLRATYWTPLFFISCIAFIVLTLLIFAGPSIMSPQIIEMPVSETMVELDKTTEGEAAQEEKYSEPDEQEAQEFKTYEIGDLIEVGDLVIQVNSIRTAEKEEWEMLEEGYIYLFVDISIENTGNQEAYLDTYYNFRLVDKNGRNYKFVWAESAKGHIEGNLGAGRKIAGELSYGIPSDVKDFELEISDPNPGMLGTEMVIVNISLVE